MNGPIGDVIGHTCGSPELTTLNVRCEKALLCSSTAILNAIM